jgi:antitoxin component YwqK of YwqJK toxin-antitoxin module
MKDLAEREGIYYKKFSEVPFTGKVTGKTQGSFRNGKKHGPWVKYHDNGQLYFKGTYKDGKEEGPWVYYDDNGTKRFSTERYLWDEGTGIYKNGVKVK